MYNTASISLSSHTFRDSARCKWRQLFDTSLNANVSLLTSPPFSNLLSSPCATVKRRSKSAHAGRTIDGEPKIAQPKTLTFNLNQNTTIEYQRRQFFGEIPDEASAAANARPRYNYNNLANMHANVM